MIDISKRPLLVTLTSVNCYLAGEEEECYSVSEQDWPPDNALLSRASAAASWPGERGEERLHDSYSLDLGLFSWKFNIKTPKGWVLNFFFGIDIRILKYLVPI